MVATRSPKEVVAFVIGRERIDPDTIAVEQWVEILRGAIKELPINYLRGLRSVKQIIEYDGSHGVARVVKGPFPTLGEQVGGGGRRKIRNNDVFLRCAESGLDQFPHHRGEGFWQNAPRSKKPGARFSEPIPLETEHLLLSREGLLYRLLVSWAPRANWDENHRSSTPCGFWYEADLAKLRLVELDDSGLLTWLSADSEGQLPQTMLVRFHLALRETAEDIRGQYDRIRRKEQVIDGYLNRIGVPL